MNREQPLQAWPVAVAPARANRPVVPVLIQVPRVLVGPRRPGRWSSDRATKPRRRLRRPVRWALYALLALLPAAVSALAYWQGRQAALLEIRAPGGLDPTAETLPPRISLSIEPAAAVPAAEPAAPVVFPGYLLPDDGLEDPAHAGN